MQYDQALKVQVGDYVAKKHLPIVKPQFHRVNSRHVYPTSVFFVCDDGKIYKHTLIQCATSHYTDTSKEDKKS